jgi:hypothetical protein
LFQEVVGLVQQLLGFKKFLIHAEEHLRVKIHQVEAVEEEKV